MPLTHLKADTMSPFIYFFCYLEFSQLVLQIMKAKIYSLISPTEASENFLWYRQIEKGSKENPKWLSELLFSLMVRKKQNRRPGESELCDKKAKVKNLNLSAKGIFESFFAFAVKYFICVLPQANTFLMFSMNFFYHISASLTQIKKQKP